MMLTESEMMAMSEEEYSDYLFMMEDFAEIHALDDDSENFLDEMSLDEEFHGEWPDFADGYEDFDDYYPDFD